MTTKQVSYFFICALMSTSISLLCMKTSEINPNNTKFAFDFHEVIATEPFACLNDAKKILSWDLVPAFNRQLPWFIYKLLTSMVYNPTGECFKNICNQYEQKQLVSNIGKVGNSFTLIEDTVSIMQELKDKGYELDLLSNIESLFLDELKNNAEYKDIQEKVLKLFTNTISVNYWSYFHLTPPIRKPDLRFFRTYQEEYNKDKKQIVFVDDRLKNISVSEQTDMIGIHFQNPQQLRDELVKMGIL